MSPNEFQLRAALQDGEGELPSADLAIARALRVRIERRRRITSVASAAAVVAVVAVGGTLLLRSGSGRESGGTAGGAAASFPAFQATHGGNPQPETVGGAPVRSADNAQADGSDTQKAFGLACPAQFPRLMLPGGGGTNQFGADRPLFDSPVAAMKICRYDAAGAAVGSSVLGTAAASDVATKLDNGSSTRPTCASVTSEGSLAIYAVTAGGTTQRLVTLDLGCPFQATNGTAVRYLSAATVGAMRTGLTPSPNHGSPVK